MIKANNYQEICAAAFRMQGGRVTQARLAVAKCLQDAKSPLSAREIFDIICEDSSSPGLDQVSVYRVLESMLQLDLVHQVSPSGGYLACLHSECSSTHHILIRCGACLSVAEVDVPEELIEPLAKYLRKKKGFEVKNHIFQMDGNCTTCQPVVTS